MMPRTFSSELLTFFRDMALMRRMKIAADSLYKAKLIRGFCHLYDGQEAVAVGMEAASQKWTPSSPPTATTAPSSAAAARSPRSSPSSWAAGMGARRGRESGFYGGHGIVGAQVPLRCGLAFAQKYSKDESVTFAMYGDGAANQGQLFEEALNIAALWDLPAILL
ncbi:hypothetical protein GYH30_053025 [Glycine max]|uniref:Dehydrogenase E1 component domain-containing protein n=1 Tax=Glycine max TaxID=3847 RepID=A0A0R0EY07_SOYBN|nr:hypothetical protein GYH30_053025 [Glycine max]